MFLFQLVVVEAGTLQEGVGSGTTTSGVVETLVGVAGVMGGMTTEIKVSIQDVAGVALDAMEKPTSVLIRMELGGAGGPGLKASQVRLSSRGLLRELFFDTRSERWFLCHYFPGHWKEFQKYWSE